MGYIFGSTACLAYALEADTLGALAQSAAFGDVVRRFGSYEDYLKRLLDRLIGRALDRIISDEGIVDVAVPSKELVLLFCQAQIAACTELFKGWKFQVTSSIDRECARSLINQQKLY